MKLDFSAYLSSLIQSPLVESIRAIYEASEGDARKYMKKMLQSMGLEQDLLNSHGDNWSEEVFNMIRNAFVHQGCDVYFVPGIARIAFGELDYDTDGENTQKLALLKNLVKFISTAHKDQFTRNLEKIDVVQTGPQKGMKVKSKPLTLEQLASMFSREQKEVSGKARDRLAAEMKNSSGNGYKIIELKNFEQAHQFLPYCTSDKWCYLQNESTFDSYASGGNKLYLALAPGFEKLKPGDPGYGRSMIGFDMGPVDEDGKSELCVCTNRYNHAENLEHEKGVGSGDAAYDEIQLSKILGFPVWERCPGYTVDEMLANGLINKESMRTIVTNRDQLEKLVNDKAYREEFRNKYNVEVREEWNSPGFSVEFHKLNRHGNYSNSWYVMATDQPDVLIWFESFKKAADDVYTLKLATHKYMLVYQNGQIFYNDVFYKIGGDIFPLGVAKMIDGEKRYNYIGYNRKLLSDTWFTAIGSFDRYTNFACVSNDEGKENIISKDGQIMLPHWYDNIQREYEKAFYYKISDGNKGYLILDDKLNPFCQWVDRIVRSAEGLVVRSHDKFNMVIPRQQCMLSEHWFDSMDETTYISINGGYCMLVRDEGLGCNFIYVETHKPMLDKWYPYIKYLEHGFFLVKDNGKLNIYEACQNKFMLPQWFDDTGTTPKVYGYDNFQNLWLDGKKCKVVCGKIMPDRSDEEFPYDYDD